MDGREIDLPHAELARQRFQRTVATYVLVVVLSVGIWLIQGADGLITVRHREIRVGFWPGWPMVVGFVVVAKRAWETFGQPDR